MASTAAWDGLEGCRCGAHAGPVHAVWWPAARGLAPPAQVRRKAGQPLDGPRLPPHVWVATHPGDERCRVREHRRGPGWLSDLRTRRDKPTQAAAPAEGGGEAAEPGPAEPNEDALLLMDADTMLAPIPPHRPSAFNLPDLNLAKRLTLSGTPPPGVVAGGSEVRPGCAPDRDGEERRCSCPSRAWRPLVPCATPPRTGRRLGGGGQRGADDGSRQEHRATEAALRGPGPGGGGGADGARVGAQAGRGRRVRPPRAAGRGAAGGVRRDARQEEPQEEAASHGEGASDRAGADGVRGGASEKDPLPPACVQGVGFADEDDGSAEEDEEAEEEDAKEDAAPSEQQPAAGAARKLVARKAAPAARKLAKAHSKQDGASVGGMSMAKRRAMLNLAESDDEDEKESNGSDGEGGRASRFNSRSNSRAGNRSATQSRRTSMAGAANHRRSSMGGSRLASLAPSPVPGALPTSKLAPKAAATSEDEDIMKSARDVRRTQTLQPRHHQTRREVALQLVLLSAPHALHATSGVHRPSAAQGPVDARHGQHHGSRQADHRQPLRGQHPRAPGKRQARSARLAASSERAGSKALPSWRHAAHRWLPASPTRSRPSRSTWPPRRPSRSPPTAAV